MELMCDHLLHGGKSPAAALWTWTRFAQENINISVSFLYTTVLSLAVFLMGKKPAAVSVLTGLLMNWSKITPKITQWITLTLKNILWQTESKNMCLSYLLISDKWLTEGAKSFSQFEKLWCNAAMMMMYQDHFSRSLPFGNWPYLMNSVVISELWR